MNLAAVFGSVVSLEAGDHVKNAFQFTDYYDGYGFYGQLTTVTTNELYAVKLAIESTLRFSGTPT